MNKKLVHYSGNTVTIDSEKAKEYANLVNKIAKLEKELKPLQEQLESELKVVMEKLTEKHVTSNGLKVTLKDGYTRQSFDTTSFKEDNIDLYNKYLKSSEVASKISISLEG